MNTKLAQMIKPIKHKTRSNRRAAFVGKVDTSRSTLDVAVIS